MFLKLREIQIVEEEKTKKLTHKEKMKLSRSDRKVGYNDSDLFLKCCMLTLLIRNCFEEFKRERTTRKRFRREENNRFFKDKIKTGSQNFFIK